MPTSLYDRHALSMDIHYEDHNEVPNCSTKQLDSVYSAAYTRRYGDGILGGAVASRTGRKHDKSFSTYFLLEGLYELSGSTSMYTSTKRKPRRRTPMQEMIQAEAERIARQFNVPVINVQRRRELITEAGRMEAMRHEMAHHIHAAQIAAKGIGNGDNKHGRNWRKIAGQVGCQPNDSICKRGKVDVRGIVGRIAVAAPVAAKRITREECVTKADWKRFITQEGLQELGRGASRATFALSDTEVIKYDYNHWVQCNSEAAAWETANEELRSMLGRVIASGDGWIVMERAKMTLGHMRMGAAETTISSDLRKATGIGDLHAANIGYFGRGIFKIIDYAL